MKGKTVNASTGLVFCDDLPVDLTQAADRASDMLDSHCLHVESVKFWSDSSVQIRTRTLDVWLTLHQSRQEEETEDETPELEPDALTYLCVNQTDRPDIAADDSTCQATLFAHLLRALQDELGADYIKWMGPFDLLSGTEFMRITRPLDEADQIVRVQTSDPAPNAAHLTPQVARVALELATASVAFDHEVQRLVSWAQAPQDQERLRTQLRTSFRELPIEIEEPKVQPDLSEPTPPLKASAWVMSGSVALLCLPMGAALFVINALRGANLRLACQTAALTGTFVSLQSTGATAQTANLLQGIFF